MKQIQKAIADSLQELIDLQTELQTQQDRYAAIIKANESLDKLHEAHSKINYLKVELETKQNHVLALFQSLDA